MKIKICRFEGITDMLFPEQGLTKFWSLVGSFSAFRCSGGEFQISGPRNITLFLSYAAVFQFTHFF